MTNTKRISQSDLPRVSIEQALRIPRALADQFGGQPTDPVSVAAAVEVKPSSSWWRDLTGSATGFGLTVGGYGASQIELTDLGRRIVSPRVDGEEVEGLFEACLKPTVIRGFLNKYDGSKFPRDEIACNVLVGEFGVPQARADDALKMIVQCAETTGAFRSIRGDRFVSLSRFISPEKFSNQTEGEVGEGDQSLDSSADGVEPVELARAAKKRIVETMFIGHSKGAKVLDQVKQLLELADVAHEVVVEQESAAIPVPDKVFEAMRRSDAAIICVTADRDQETEERYEVNPNVLIEIGAAYVCFDRRLVLLWDRRVKVPSNLQGLYRCEFEGDELSWEAGTRLQKALIAIKKGQSPT